MKNQRFFDYLGSNANWVCVMHGYYEKAEPVEVVIWCK